MENKPKRKYVKKSKMQLRSNNDYIDHTYWPTIRLKSEQGHANMMKKYGIPDLRQRTEPAVFSDTTKKFNESLGIGRHHAINPTPPVKRILLEDEEV